MLRPLGGSIRLHSVAGAGMHITVDLPLEYELALGLVLAAGSSLVVQPGSSPG